MPRRRGAASMRAVYACARLRKKSSTVGSGSRTRSTLANLTVSYRLIRIWISNTVMGQREHHCAGCETRACESGTAGVLSGFARCRGSSGTRRAMSVGWPPGLGHHRPRPSAGRSALRPGRRRSARRRGGRTSCSAATMRRSVEIRELIVSRTRGLIHKHSFICHRRHAAIKRLITFAPLDKRHTAVARGSLAHPRHPSSVEKTSLGLSGLPSLRRRTTSEARGWPAGRIAMRFMSKGSDRMSVVKHTCGRKERGSRRSLGCQLPDRYLWPEHLGPS